MKAILRAMIFIVSAALLSASVAVAGAGRQGPGKPQVEVDPKSGRAVGAKEMQPDQLRKLIDRKAKTIIIDVRDEAQFQKETIKGAIHIPFSDLEARLKEFPKDTTLVFT